MVRDAGVDDAYDGVCCHFFVFFLIISHSFATALPRIYLFFRREVLI